MDVWPIIDGIVGKSHGRFLVFLSVSLLWRHEVSKGGDMVQHGHSAAIQQLLAVLPGKPAPYAGKIPDKRPKQERYVRFDLATWADLQGFLQDRAVRARWVRGSDAKTRARLWHEDLRSKLQVLAPYMARNPTMTVAEACRLMAHDRENAANTASLHACSRGT